MLAVGNLNKISRARQQVFYADAAAQWASAQHKATAAREALVRILGLTTEQAVALTLPERLPNLPKTPLAGAQVASDFVAQRLDLRMAQMDYNAAAKAQGLNAITSFVDVEMGVRRDTIRELDENHRSIKRGVELEVRLPIFDWGDARRQGMNAQTLAAANRLEATQRAAGSHLRESYSAYRTAYDIAKHYRDEIVPLRQLINDESVLRYNGMIDGIFELLTDAREQLMAVTATINAQQQFWLAEANLSSTVLGKPAGSGGEIAAPMMGKSEAKGH
jgi:outer membrane protein TolC